MSDEQESQKHRGNRIVARYKGQMTRGEWQIQDLRFKIKTRSPASEVRCPESDCRSPRSEDRRPKCGYFFIRSNTALVMDFTPVRSVGSGTGAHKLECNPGSGTPVRRLSASFAGSTAPSQNRKTGI